jgi:hypothetical protein
MNHTNIAMAILTLTAIATTLLVALVTPMYQQEVNAATKTYSQSTSMSTSCNGPDGPCQTIGQTIVCEDDKPCRTISSNSTTGS